LFFAARQAMGYSVRSGCMRFKFAALLLMAIPAVAVAQSPAPGPGAFPALPPIGLPLPPIGLPLPPIGLSPATDPHSRTGGNRPPRGLDNQQLGLGSRRPFRSQPTVVYFVPTIGWGYPFGAQTLGASVPGTPTPDRRYERLTGSVRLDVQPAGMLQFYVDGYYVGTANDTNGELELEAGPHTIEIRAPGYETLSFDVRITAQRLITYRGALTPMQPPTDPVQDPNPPQPETPAPPTTIYFIPGCYLGNVPPEKVALPADCDLSKLITRKP
jgi:hypothetical protein